MLAAVTVVLVVVLAVALLRLVVRELLIKVTTVEAQSNLITAAVVVLDRLEQTATALTRVAKVETVLPHLLVDHQ